jgi:N-acetylneuraminic acid mutarotase
MKKIYILIASVLVYGFGNAQNIGIGTSTPQSKLSVGANSQFQIDSVGNTKRINNIPIAFPSVQAANKQTIMNDGAGNLSWSYGMIPSGGIIMSTTNDTNIVNQGFTLIGMKTDSIQLFNPVSNGWNTAISTIGAPSPRIAPTMIWTGTEYIIWGGGAMSAYVTNGTFNDGFRYNPTTNTWTAISTVGAPTSRFGHCAVWTGTEMIVWGGVNWTQAQYNNGGRYNPSTNTWTTMSTTGAPSARVDMTAVWSGTEMIVWGGGGSGYKNDGARYNPTTNTWTSVNPSGAPAARAVHSAIWTGSEMIIWGGYNAGPTPYNDGKRYNPTTNTWGATTSTVGAPNRGSHTAIFNGSEMIVWGGDNAGPASFNDGYRYNVTTNTWVTPLITQVNAPSARGRHASAWSGSEMFVWGGTNGSIALGNGGRLTSGGGFGNKTAITYYYFRKN